MTRLDIRPFSDEFLPHAGELLAARHRAHRAAEPLLSARYENAEAAAAEVEALARSEGASGAVALRGTRVVGFLLGMRKNDDIWGANVWVETAGHAVEAAEDLRDLYGAAAARWFEEGRDRHYSLVPATDPAVLDAWSRVSFGQQHAYGIREVPDVAWPESVRRAEERDLDALVELAPLLQDHQSLAPVFGGGMPQESAPGSSKTSARRRLATSSRSRTAGSLERSSWSPSSCRACTSLSRGPMVPRFSGGLRLGRTCGDRVRAWHSPTPGSPGRESAATRRW
jgi:hypothetical protein